MIKRYIVYTHSIDIPGRRIKSQILFTKSSLWALVFVTCIASGPTYLYPLCLLYSNHKIWFQFPKGPGSYLILSLACLSPPHLSGPAEILLWWSFPNFSCPPENFCLLCYLWTLLRIVLFHIQCLDIFVVMSSPSPTWASPESSSIMVVLPFLVYSTKECWLNESVYECESGPYVWYLYFLLYHLLFWVLYFCLWSILINFISLICGI